MRVQTRTRKRLEFFGKQVDSYDDILNKLMDCAEGRRRRDNVAGEKEWMRSSEEYQKLLPQPQLRSLNE
jgi:hypothetical protein